MKKKDFLLAADILNCYSVKATNSINNGFVQMSCPSKPWLGDSEQTPYTETTSSFYYLHQCFFPTGTCQNVSSENTE